MRVTNFQVKKFPITSVYCIIKALILFCEE